MVLQKFDFVLDNPQYELELKQALTIKPANFYVHALPREGRHQLLATPSAAAFSFRSKEGLKAALPASPGTEARQPMYVLYGSNTGTSESFAQRIANDAAAYGMFHLRHYAAKLTARHRLPCHHGYARHCRRQSAK